jgi:hypothetical protein
MEPYAAHVVKDLKKLGRKANSLGCYGVTAYHCWNYIAPQHFDEDATWTISYQLKKLNCKSDEFGFVFGQWGHVLETVENCVWLVRPLFIQSVFRNLSCFKIGGSEEETCMGQLRHVPAHWKLVAVCLKE